MDQAIADELAKAEAEIAALKNLAAAAESEALKTVIGLETRSFGRDSADTPVVVTPATGGQ